MAPVVPSAPLPAVVFLFLSDQPPSAAARELGTRCVPDAEWRAVAGLADAEQWLAGHAAAALVLLPRPEPATELRLLAAGAGAVLDPDSFTPAAVQTEAARARARAAALRNARRRSALAASIAEALAPGTATLLLALPGFTILDHTAGADRVFGPGCQAGQSLAAALRPESRADLEATAALAQHHPGEAIAVALALTGEHADGGQVSGRLLDLRARPEVGALVLAAERATAPAASTGTAAPGDRLLRDLADRAPVHIWIEDALRRLVWENQTALEFTGRSFADEAGYGWLETVHREDRARVEQHYRETSREQRGFTLEFRMRRHDGAWRHILQVAIPRWDDARTFVGFLGVDMDITELREAGRRAEEAESRYRLFVEQATDGIWRFELRNPVPVSLPEAEVIARIFADGWLAECNPAMARQYGFADPAALIGLALGDLMHPDDPANLRMLGEFIRSGYRLNDAESHERDRDGQPKIFLNNLVGIIERGHLIRAWGTQRDITIQRQLEDEARQSRKLETAGRLAGGVAHDFNNLLTAILGTSEMLLASLDPGTAEHEDVEEIKRAATRAANLTRQLLAFSRRQVLQPRTLDLTQLVLGVESLLRRLIGEHITLTTRAAPGLWRVRADPGQLEQVIVNLCVNARDAMPTGGGLTVATENMIFEGALHGAESIMPPGPYVQLTVSDTGVGMDPDTLLHIFEPFFTTKEHGKGTGLGLATVYGIVKQSGGYIFVDTAPGRGSRFRVYLPRVEGTAEALEAAPEPRPARATGTILLVEDEESVRRLARRVLEDVGYRVLEAPDGPAALALASQWDQGIDLCITDVIMPGMSGQELSARLRTRLPTLPILYVSGYTDDTILQHGDLLPNTTFLQKPFSPAALAQRVAEALA